MSREARKNFLFLGFAIPDKEMEKVFSIDSLPQVQTHKFNWNLIKGLEYLDEFDITYVSARPVTDYPSFNQKKIKKNKWTVNIDGKIVDIQEIPFLNIGTLKLITRFFSAIYYSFRSFWSKSNKAGVIVYSVHVPYMIVGIIVSKIYKIDYIAIWTDPPAVIGSKESSLKSKLRIIELRLSKYLMKKATKVIALTRYLAEDFAPCKPYLIMEGIIDIKDMNCLQNKENNLLNEPLKVVYTGSLAKIYGIQNIVDAFLHMKNQNVILEIYGRGDYVDDLLKITKVNNNIRYKGFVSNNEVLKIQRNADFLINARSTEEEFVKYSFPSKTLEYMLSGTPLITTMLPGIPDEYKQYVIELEDNKPSTIEITIRSLLTQDKNEFESMGQKAKFFALSKNYQNQGRRIIDFINS